MLDDLKKWVGDGRDLDRDFRDANGATPVGTSVVSNENGKTKMPQWFLTNNTPDRRQK